MTTEEKERKSKKSTEKEAYDGIKGWWTGCCFGIFTLVSILPLFIYGGIVLQYDAFSRVDSLLAGTSWQGDETSGDYLNLLVGFILSMVSLFFGFIAFVVVNLVYHWVVRGELGRGWFKVSMVFSFLVTVLAMATLVFALILFIIEYADSTSGDIHYHYTIPLMLLTAAGSVLWGIGAIALLVIGGVNWSTYRRFVVRHNEKGEIQVTASSRRSSSSYSSSTTTGSRRGFSKMERY